MNYDDNKENNINFAAGTKRIWKIKRWMIIDKEKKLKQRNDESHRVSLLGWS